MREHLEVAREHAEAAEAAFKNEPVPYDMQILLAIYEMLLELHDALTVREPA